ncbi:MAG: tRNA (adenosine(37)-N6)-dimethylallyltransferase MiaA [Chitinophagales bacterium]|nr:tRNA (adenosine(37)-N6)-dimethylallyltransferase MiaA [Chitinophagales bacterium]
MQQNYLIVLVGPTAVGKTQVSIEIAKYFSTEVISADARQFYRELNIGTAKPLGYELKQIDHHFINNLSIIDRYSVADFEKEALAVIERLFLHKNILVVTGGSGLFIKAILEGLDSIPEVSNDTEEHLKILFRDKGIEALQLLLKQHDPDYYKAVDLNNPHRLIRALSVSISSGKPFSSFLTSKVKNRNFIPVKIGLQLERKDLYSRIDERTDRMMNEGLLEEVKFLLAHQHRNSLQTVGYRELISYLNHNCTLDEAVLKIKQRTRNYAKRQMTWFKKDKEINWFAPNEIDNIIMHIERVTA